MKYYLLLFSILFAFQQALSQPTAGTTGLLNIPTADMQPDGTFLFGGNYLPEPMNPEKIGYNTGNYYINITFLPFWEVNYRLTLLKIKSNGTYNQDRSFALRGRLLKERKYLPSLVIGGNDIYTTSKGKGNQYFGCLYAVSTKKIEWDRNIISVTIGFASDVFHRDQYSGWFGGVSFSPSFFRQLSLMAEYDSKAWNAGASLFLFNHLQLYAFAYNLKYFSGGVAYKVYLKK